MWIHLPVVPSRRQPDCRDYVMTLTNTEPAMPGLVTGLAFKTLDSIKRMTDGYGSTQ